MNRCIRNPNEVPWAREPGLVLLVLLLEGNAVVANPAKRVTSVPLNANIPTLQGREEQ